MIFVLTNVKIFSVCVIKAILDQLNCFMTCIIPTSISASLDTVLRKFGNISTLERRIDDAAGDIWKNTTRTCKCLLNLIGIYIEYSNCSTNGS